MKIMLKILKTVRNLEKCLTKYGPILVKKIQPNIIDLLNKLAKVLQVQSTSVSIGKLKKFTPEKLLNFKIGKKAI